MEGTVQLIQISLPDLEAMMTKVVKNNQPVVIENKDKWLDAKESIKYLGISRPKFFKLVKEGILKAYCLEGTGLKRYKQSELDSLLIQLD